MCKRCCPVDKDGKMLDANCKLVPNYKQDYCVEAGNENKPGAPTKTPVPQYKCSGGAEVGNCTEPPTTDKDLELKHALDKWVLAGVEEAA